MIIGVTGKNAAGKGLAIEYYKSIGYSAISLSDIIREEATLRNLPHSRDNLINIGNELRTNFGPNILAARSNIKIKELLKSSKGVVIDSIRNEHEITELRKNNNFKLLAIMANPKVRFERIVARNRLGDPKTFEEFIELENREAKGNSNAQQLDRCIEISDIKVTNESKKEEFEDKLSKLFQ